jgi:hypothetical protein
MELVARSGGDLGGIETVRIDASLETGLPGSEPSLTRASWELPTDNDAPRALIDLPAVGAALRSGPQTVHGHASDKHGDGVAKVELRLDGGAWQPATGTNAWVATIQVPASGAFTLEARATDTGGLVGPATSVRIAVDNAVPTVSLDPVAPVLDDSDTVLTGRAADASAAAVADVDIAIDGVWVNVPGPYAEQPDGSVVWHFLWSYPGESGVKHTLAVRATDAAGNTSAPSAPVTVTVDSLRPVSTIERPLAGSTVAGEEVTLWGYADDGWGVSRVEVSLDGGQTWQPALLGAAASALVNVPVPAPRGTPDTSARGSTKLYLPLVHSGRAENGTVLWALKVRAPYGNLALRSRAVDLAGNLESLRAPVRVQHVAR